jgi:hypothetical protein
VIVFRPVCSQMERLSRWTSRHLRGQSWVLRDQFVITAVWWHSAFGTVVVRRRTAAACVHGQGTHGMLGRTHMANIMKSLAKYHWSQRVSTIQGHIYTQCLCVLVLQQYHGAPTTCAHTNTHLQLECKRDVPVRWLVSGIFQLKATTVRVCSAQTCDT